MASFYIPLTGLQADSTASEMALSRCKHGGGRLRPAAAVQRARHTIGRGIGGGNAQVAGNKIG